MGLGRYRSMRRFGETPEPAGGAARQRREPIFVVQLHHASHRHYDFRLEVDGVLKSWAVPKGPSFDPKVKRLAMQVEDHPIEYAAFEGRISEGNYGAGDVRIFDRGTWSIAASAGDVHRQLTEGHLHFALHGDKLRGSWDLVRTGAERGKPRWLLRKAEDEEAGPFESDDLLGYPARQLSREGLASPSPRRGGAAAGPPNQVAPSGRSRRRWDRRGGWLRRRFALRAWPQLARSRWVGEAG